jgi:hypothetical protein
VAALESASYSFDLDVFTRKVNTAIQPTPDSETLGRAVAAEMQEPDWQRLADLFLTTKRRVMKTMDINAVRAQFPAEAMTGGGSMVGYVEVFPWADPWNFQLGADWWLADDQYCVRPDCACTQTALTFFRLPKRTPFWRNKVKQIASLRYDYVSRVTEPIESEPRNPAAGELQRTKAFALRVIKLVDSLVRMSPGRGRVHGFRIRGLAATRLRSRRRRSRSIFPVASRSSSSADQPRACA